MQHSLIKAGAVAFVFGGLALSGQAFALSPLPMDHAASFTIPATDEEEKAVEEHLNHAETPPGSQDQAAPESPVPEAGRSEEAGKGGGGDVEEQELQNMFPSTDWPKK
jgi:hypothetical protein